MADGTAQQCGRVGSCHILLKRLSDLRRKGVFVFCLNRGLRGLHGFHGFVLNICPVRETSLGLSEGDEAE